MLLIINRPVATPIEAKPNLLLHWIQLVTKRALVSQVTFKNNHIFDGIVLEFSLGFLF